MKDSTGNYINYGPFQLGADGMPTAETMGSLTTMLMGSASFSTVAGSNPLLTKVDYSAWDLSQACGSCHVGGGFVEKDREGKRFSMMSPFVDGITPYTMTIFERYDATTGLPAHTVEPAPWSYPIWNGSTPVTADAGWGQPMTMTLPDGSAMPVVDKQVMMPNVKEMDCLMCHFQGYNNLMSSVMAYSGAHNATPSFGAGFMNMFTQAYDFATGLLQKDGNGVVSLSSLGLSKMKYDPPSQNCRNCHMPSNLKDLPDMMSDFLSSAPMIYNGNFDGNKRGSFTGLTMPAFDFNAPISFDRGATAYTWDWTAAYATSPTLYMTMTGIGSTTPGFTGTTIPAGWPAAMGMSEFNKPAFDAFSTAMPGMKQYFLGGGNRPGTGPIYYQATLADGMHQDQNVLKKSTVPFPRAEWFKRGDLWEPGYDVHMTLECAGCHMNTATTKTDKYDASGNLIFDGKSDCDPGRGYDSAGGVEANPAFKTTVNSQNTVKSCEACHVTGKNHDGVVVDTYGAPDPASAHKAAGLLANVTNAVRLNAATGAEENFTGSHLDVVDCTVCHLSREQMVVRLLDCTSGNRYPNMLGFDENRGMMGMFSDPMGQQWPVGNNLKKWDPLYTWQKGGSDAKGSAGSWNAEWRRKIYAVNLITAAIWNNVDANVDANGDGVPGRAPSIHPGTPEVSPSTNYDPWISRDMKAGINYGPSGFAPIPVGFGDNDALKGPFAVNFQSAYNADGSFTGALKYVGVYGGNAMFSTPQEISGYKSWRNSIKAGVDNKDWTGTQLALVAGPYKLTHGIRATEKFVLGKKTETGFGCADCHAPAATAKVAFFDGTINMVGTAVNTHKAIQAGKGFMEASAELMEIVGAKEDIDTATEVATKAGGAVEVKFEELGDWDGAAFSVNPAGEYKRVTEMDRNEALYPAVSGVSFTDINGNSYADRDAWRGYLTGITPAQAGIGVAPVASIVSTVTDLDPAAAGTQVAANAAVTLTAGVAQTGGVVSYSWSSSDGTVIPAGKESSVTFTTTGSKTVTLSVTDEEGNKAFATLNLQVVAVPAEMISWNDAAGSLGGVMTVAGMPTPNDKVKIVWGDGKYQYVTLANAASISRAHVYLTAGNKLVQVYIYKAGVLVGTSKKSITVNGGN
uniref:PKD domain containing protein n=1 Tax=Geobacter sp. (strain M21) TaxID=443144 RepID=C6E3D8_GEOSM